MVKLQRRAHKLELLAMAGIEAASDGLALATQRGIATTHEGADGLMRLECFKDIGIVFDVTSVETAVQVVALSNP